jgi:Uma2 family endonuclease
MTVERQPEWSMPEIVKARSWTYELWRRLPDDGNRYEIVEGALFVTPPPRKRHQKAAGTIHALLWIYLESNPIGECYMAPLDVKLSRKTVVEPDILFVSRDRVEIATEEGLIAAPDLVVEVLSKSTRHRDLGAKRRTYAKNGVREYWIVDPDHRRVDVYTLQRGSLVKRVHATSGEVASPLVLPGFSVPLAKLFA